MTTETKSTWVDSHILSYLDRIFDAKPETIARELYQNSARAGATEVTLTLTKLEDIEGDFLHFEMKDNGCGCDVDSLLGASASEWNPDLRVSEDSAGLGFFSIAGLMRVSASAAPVHIDVSSRKAGADTGFESTWNLKVLRHEEDLEVRHHADVPFGTIISGVIPATVAKGVFEALSEISHYTPPHQIGELPKVHLYLGDDSDEHSPKYLPAPQGGAYLHLINECTASDPEVIAPGITAQMFVSYGVPGYCINPMNVAGSTKMVPTRIDDAAWDVEVYPPYTAQGLYEGCKFIVGKTSFKGAMLGSGLSKSFTVHTCDNNYENSPVSGVVLITADTCESVQFSLPQRDSQLPASEDLKNAIDDYLVRTARELLPECLAEVVFSRPDVAVPSKIYTSVEVFSGDGSEVTPINTEAGDMGTYTVCEDTQTVVLLEDSDVTYPPFVYSVNTKKFRGMYHAGSRSLTFWSPWETIRYDECGGQVRHEDSQYIAADQPFSEFASALSSGPEEPIRIVSESIAEMLVHSDDDTSVALTETNTYAHECTYSTQNVRDAVRNLVRTKGYARAVHIYDSVSLCIPGFKDAVPEDFHIGVLPDGSTLVLTGVDVQGVPVSHHIPIAIVALPDEVESTMTPEVDDKTKVATFPLRITDEDILKVMGCPKDAAVVDITDSVEDSIRHDELFIVATEAHKHSVGVGHFRVCYYYGDSGPDRAEEDSVDLHNYWVLHNLGAQEGLKGVIQSISESYGSALRSIGSVDEVAFKVTESGLKLSAVNGKAVEPTTEA